MKSKIAVLIPIHKELTSHTSDERALLEQTKKVFKDRPLFLFGPDSLASSFRLEEPFEFTPFDGNPKKVSDLLLQLFNNGLMGFTTGDNPLRIRFLLPLGAINKTDIEEAIQIIDKTINEIK